MFRRLAMISGVIAVALLLNGCSTAQWLQQMRTVLGRLGALAAILQVGPLASATGY
jgi:hypothetical protein